MPEEKFNPEKPDARTSLISDPLKALCTQVFMDLFSTKIIAWVLNDTLEAKWAVDVIEKAKVIRNVEKPKIIHTDRGIQYICREYVEGAEGMQRSYLKKAYP